MMDFVSNLDIADKAKAMLIVAGIEVMQREKRPWTDRDLDIVRKNYPTGGVSKCAEQLPDRTVGSIGFKARTLKLKRPPSKRRSPFPSSPHIDEVIRRYYQGTPRWGGLSKLAHQVGRPVPWVSSRARDLGVQIPRFDSRKWSQAEIDLLRKNAAKVPCVISRIFRKNGFHRSGNAILIKLRQFRCDRTDDDMYSAKGLAELFGFSPPVVSGWIKKGWLKVHMRGTAHPHDVYVIHHKAVRRFVIENVGAIDIRRADKHWLVDLLAGNS